MLPPHRPISPHLHLQDDPVPWMSPSQGWASGEYMSSVVPGAGRKGKQTLAHRQKTITIYNSVIAQWPNRLIESIFGRLSLVVGL